MIYRNLIGPLVASLVISGAALGQNGRFPPPVVSPEISESGVSLRVSAPEAESVSLGGSDIPGLGREGGLMTKNDEGLWEITLEDLAPGYYRYHFNLDGVSVVDPRNPKTSQSNGNTWSLLEVPGASWMDTQDVPHGAVAEVVYHSESLGRPRRMHVYTPPGYESGEGEFPIFYLLHGAGDCDDSWSTVGRAGFILDNLIAAGKAKPMVVVMPAGHTGPFRWGGGMNMSSFVEDFNQDIRPYVESHYRVKKDRANRAIAGLSMGGAHTLDIGIPNLEDFAYLGVYSSGVFGINGRGPGGQPQGPTYEERNAEKLDNPELKEGLELFWFATGKDDFLLETSRATVAMFRKHDFEVVYKETEGAHTWIVWREYLQEFAQALFQ